MMAAVPSADSGLYEKFNTDGTVRTNYDASGQQVAMVNLDRSSGATTTSVRFGDINNPVLVRVEDFFLWSARPSRDRRKRRLPNCSRPPCGGSRRGICAAPSDFRWWFWRAEADFAARSVG